MRPEYDLGKYTVTVAIDFTDAFGLVSNELTYHTLLVCSELVIRDALVRARLLAAGISIPDRCLCHHYLHA